MRHCNPCSCVGCSRYSGPKEFIGTSTLQAGLLLETQTCVEVTVMASMPTEWNTVGQAMRIHMHFVCYGAYLDWFVIMVGNATKSQLFRNGVLSCPISFACLAAMQFHRNGAPKSPMLLARPVLDFKTPKREVTVLWGIKNNSNRK